MPKLRLKILVSLDGFVGGPNQRVQDPPGVGDDRHGLALARTVA